MSTSAVVRRIRGLCALGLLGLGLVATAGAAKPPPVIEDGLELTKSKGIDVLYRRPGVSLAGYTKIMLDPVEDAFSKSWNSRDYGTFGLKSTDVEKIRSEVAMMARDTFVKVLKDGGYPEVSAADAGMLRVTANIVDLYINAPENMEAGRTRTYVASAGEMAIAVELRDAVTGTMLARAFDRRTASDTGRLQWSNSVMNRAEAERALDGWADHLRRALDAAKAP